MRRKVRKAEKVKKLYRSATVQKIIPACLAKSDHACAMLPDRAHQKLVVGNGRRSANAGAGSGHSRADALRPARLPESQALPEMSHFGAEFYECCVAL
jgi:hypothetical protein